jgi:hypothetical protein
MEKINIERNTEKLLPFSIRQMFKHSQSNFSFYSENTQSINDIQTNVIIYKPFYKPISRIAHKNKK